jgi:hypothetical protein
LGPIFEILFITCDELFIKLGICKISTADLKVQELKTETVPIKLKELGFIIFYNHLPAENYRIKNPIVEIEI